jgi:hypothetical protein
MRTFPLICYNVCMWCDSLLHENDGGSDIHVAYSVSSWVMLCYIVFICHICHNIYDCNVLNGEFHF